MVKGILRLLFNQTVDALECAIQIAATKSGDGVGIGLQIGVETLPITA